MSGSHESEGEDFESIRADHRSGCEELVRSFTNGHRPARQLHHLGGVLKGASRFPSRRTAALYSSPYYLGTEFLSWRQGAYTESFDLIDKVVSEKFDAKISKFCDFQLFGMQKRLIL